MKKRRASFGRIPLLVAMFAFLVVVATYFELQGQEKGAKNTPSASSYQKQGVRALYLLYQWKEFPVEQFKNPWTDLKSTDSLLVFVQPIDASRRISPAEGGALEKWVKEGGTFLGIVSPPPIDQPFDPKDTFTGDVAVHGVPRIKETVPVDSKTSPLLNSVSKLSLDSEVRLRLGKNSPYQILAQDGNKEPFLVQKKYGKGQVIVYANRSGTTNAGIEQEDNSILLLNIANSVVKESRKTIQFDEYHHGIGFVKSASEAAGYGLWENFPAALKGLVIFSSVFCLLLIYNGNRRFVPATVPQIRTLRSSADYVGSMARLYRKAGAADIAFELIFKSFLRDLKKALELEPDTSLAKLPELASKALKINPQELGELLYRSESVANGERISEKEMLYYTRKIEDFRRTYHIVGV